MVQHSPQILASEEKAAYTMRCVWGGGGGRERGVRVPSGSNPCPTPRLGLLAKGIDFTGIVRHSLVHVKEPKIAKKEGETVHLPFSFEILSDSFIAPLGFLPRGIRVAFPGKDSCDRVPIPNLRCTLGAIVFPIIHRTLTWTTASLTCECDLSACLYIRGDLSVYTASSEGC